MQLICNLFFILCCLLPFAAGVDTNYTLQPKRNAVLVLPLWDAINEGGMEVLFRTTQLNATVLYTEGPSGYMWLRLHNAELVLTLNQSDPEINVQVSIGKALDDDKFHYVKVKHELRSVVLELDKLKNPGYNIGNVALTSTRHVYIGGVPPKITPLRKEVKHYPHFSGCISELYFANDSSVFVDHSLVKPLQTIASTPGCRTPCGVSSGVCNRGVCFNDWEENKTVCDCRLTRRGGQTCSQELYPVVLSASGYRCFNRPPPPPQPLDQHIESIVIWLKAPTPHVGVIANKGASTLLLERRKIIYTADNVSISLREPDGIFDYAVSITISSQQLEMVVYSETRELYRNSTFGSFLTNDTTLCIGGGASDLPVYTRRFTAAYYQYKALTDANDCTLVNVSSSTCSKSSKIIDPVQLNHTPLASSDFTFTVQLSPSTIPMTIFTIDNRGYQIKLVYVYRWRQLVLSGNYQDARVQLVCSNKTLPLVPLEMNVKISPPQQQNSSLSLILDGKPICSTSGGVWELLVDAITNGHITLARSMVNCLENIMLYRDGQRFTASIPVHKTACNASTFPTSSVPLVTPNTFMFYTMATTFSIFSTASNTNPHFSTISSTPSSTPSPVGLPIALVAVSAVCAPALLVFLIIATATIGFVVLRSVSARRGRYRTGEESESAVSLPHFSTSFPPKVSTIAMTKEESEIYL